MSCWACDIRELVDSICRDGADTQYMFQTKNCSHWSGNETCTQLGDL